MVSILCYLRDASVHDLKTYINTNLCFNSDSEEEEEFAEALDVGVGLTADETIRLAENWTRRHSHEPNGAAQSGAGVTEPNKDDDESGSCHDSDDSRDHFSYQEYDSEGT